MFRDTDPSVLKVLEDNGMIQDISKAILKECKHPVHNKDVYTIRVEADWDNRARSRKFKRRVLLTTPTLTIHAVLQTILFQNTI